VFRRAGTPPLPGFTRQSHLAARPLRAAARHDARPAGAQNGTPPASRRCLPPRGISDTSLAYDRGRKLTAYAKAGVREYWIVNLERDILEVFRQPADGKYQVALTFTAGQSLHPLAFEDVTVPVADIIP
jgi:hypothetical protein